MRILFVAYVARDVYFAHGEGTCRRILISTMKFNKGSESQKRKGGKD